MKDVEAPKCRELWNANEVTNTTTMVHNVGNELTWVHVLRLDGRGERFLSILLPFLTILPSILQKAFGGFVSNDSSSWSIYYEHRGFKSDKGYQWEPVEDRWGIS